MLKKLALIGVALTLTACDMHKVTDKQELCAQAQRQQIYNANEPTYNPQYLMKGQQDKLDQAAATNC